tara:strand:- start:72 stop:545 length:474 start_codon:yes stop_codon:yes gene_type:complete
MKGKNHLLFGAILIVILISIGVSYDPRSNFINSFDINLFWFITGFILLIIGPLLPDSDSEDMGSFIYYTIFLIPLALIFKLFEFPISKLLNRRRGHRESLHTIVGIFLTSLFLTIILRLMDGWLQHTMNLSAFVYVFLCIFIGQLIHLLGDFHFELA